MVNLLIQLLLMAMDGTVKAISQWPVSIAIHVDTCISYYYTTLDISGGGGAAGGNAGRRDIKALANPNDPDAWHNGVSDKGLIAMALGYRKTYYTGVEGENNEACDVEDELKK